MTIRAHVPASSDSEIKALAEALAVTPSPQFVGRVRERVREEPAGTVTGWWLKLAFTGAATIALIAAATLWNGRATPERVRVANRTVAQPSAIALPQAREPEPVHTPSRMEDRPSRRSTPARAAGVPLVTRRAVVPDQSREVLVPNDQRRALDRLLVAMRGGRAAVPAPRRVLEDENGRLLEPRPIEIPLMKPIEPLPGMAADRSGSKDR